MDLFGEPRLWLVFVTMLFGMLWYFGQPKGWAYGYTLKRALRIRAKVVLLRTEIDLLFVLIVFDHLAKKLIPNHEIRKFPIRPSFYRRI